MTESDTALITRIAAKFGWKKFIPSGAPHLWSWVLPGGVRYRHDLLPSTDACLGLLEAQKLMATLEVWPHQHQKIATVYETEEGPFHTGKDSKSLPRAILLALLEVE